MTNQQIPFSVLDLMPTRKDRSHTQTMRYTLEAAQAVERFGFSRYWVAEHHNAGSLLSSATVVVMAEIAAATERIRVGSGGIMLPNHAPYVVAEQFGTLEAFHPGRIDLGLGRAPGTDPMTAQALRRDDSAAAHFPAEVQEIMGYLGSPSPMRRVHAIPGQGSNVPLYILGSSTFGASLAAQLGLPFAFASHFAPAALAEAINLYRTNFTPSRVLSEPYVIVGAAAMLADTDEQARRLFTTMQQHFLGVIRGRTLYAPPVETMDELWSPIERQRVDSMLAEAIVGSADTAQRQLTNLVERTGANEVIVMSAPWEFEDRIRSYELLSQLPIFQKAE